MASSINITNIDVTFPIAGQDNDSQGFRDNFFNTNQNFVEAKAEIEDLQDNVVLKAPLTGGSVDNDFGGGLLLNAVIENFRGTVFGVTGTSGPIIIDVANGPYQKISATTGAITELSFTGWPTAGEHSVVQVEIFISDETLHKVTLANTVTVGLDSLQNATLQVITFLSTGKHILEFASTDNGTTVSVNQLTIDLAAVSTGMNDLFDDKTPTLGGPLDVGGEIITSAAAGNIVITPDGNGILVLDGINWPISDGTNGQVLKTNGSAQLVWGDDTAGIASVSADLAPVLGGDLTVAGNSIVSTAAGDITITPDGAGKTKITNLEAPIPFNAQTADYTAVLTDAEKMITMNLTGTANTFTIPANSVAYPIGTKLNVMQLGTGITTVAINTDTLDVNGNFTLVLNGRYAVATAMKVTSTSWVLFGNLVAA